MRPSTWTPSAMQDLGYDGSTVRLTSALQIEFPQSFELVAAGRDDDALNRRYKRAFSLARSPALDTSRRHLALTIARHEPQRDSSDKFVGKSGKGKRSDARARAGPIYIRGEPRGSRPVCGGLYLGHKGPTALDAACADAPLAGLFEAGDADSLCAHWEDAADARALEDARVCCAIGGEPRGGINASAAAKNWQSDGVARHACGGCRERCGRCGARWFIQSADPVQLEAWERLADLGARSGH